MNKGIVKKWKIAPFLNNGTETVPSWVRIKKSTALDIALNPVTQDFDYIADESPTTELMQYKPSLNQALTLYKGEPDYEIVFKRFYGLKTGEDAKTQILFVFFQEEEPAGTFKAWKSDCIISVDNLNAVDSTLTFNVMFGGTVSKGSVEIVNGSPVFTSTEENNERQVSVNVKDGSANAAGATVIINGVEKLSDTSGNTSFNLIDGIDYVIGAKKGVKKGAILSGIISDSNKIFTILIV